MKPVKIFLVDDDSVFIFLTRKIISDTGIETEVQVFEDGQATIEHFKKIVDEPASLPEVIFLDLSMPVMDGWMFLEDYKELAPKLPGKIPLYLVSSTISPHDIERAKNNGLVTDLIIKPIRKEKIAEVLKSILKNR